MSWPLLCLSYILSVSAICPFLTFLVGSLCVLLVSVCKSLAGYSSPFPPAANLPVHLLSIHSNLSTILYTLSLVFTRLFSVAKWYLQYSQLKLQFCNDLWLFESLINLVFPCSSGSFPLCNLCLLASLSTLPYSPTNGLPLYLPHCVAKLSSSILYLFMSLIKMHLTCCKFMCLGIVFGTKFH